MSSCVVCLEIEFMVEVKVLLIYATMCLEKIIEKLAIGGLEELDQKEQGQAMAIA